MEDGARAAQVSERTGNGMAVPVALAGHHIGDLLRAPRFGELCYHRGMVVLCPLAAIYVC